MSAPRHARRIGDGIRRSVTMLIILMLLAGGMLVVELAVPSSGVDHIPAAIDAERGDLAVAYCPVVVGRGEQASVTVAAVGEEPSVVTLLRHTEDDGLQQADSHALQPGQGAVTRLDPGDPVTVRWRGGQVIAVWSVEGERSATGPCADGAAAVSYLAGLDTSLGSQSSLHLFNPFTVDAVVRVRYGTSEGAVDLVRTENVAVEAGRTHTLDLTELQPEEPELGVVVETLTGRVVAQGEVERTRVDEIDEGPQGRALVAAATELSTEAFFAYAVADGSAWSSRLAIFNPHDREAAVRVHATDPDPEAPVEELSVPAGGVGRVDLAGRSQGEAFAVTVESLNDLPVLVSRVEGGLRDVSGVAVPAGAPRPATRWAAVGLGGDRVELLSVHNPGGDTVRVTATVQGVPVARWQGRPLAADERQVLLMDDVEGAWPTILEADGPIVVEAVSTVRVAVPDDEGEADDDADEADDGADEAEEDADGEEADEDEQESVISDLARVVGMVRPAEVPDASVSVPRVRRDDTLSVTPAVPPDDSP